MGQIVSGSLGLGLLGTELVRQFDGGGSPFASVFNARMPSAQTSHHGVAFPWYAVARILCYAFATFQNTGADAFRTPDTFDRHADFWR